MFELKPERRKVCEECFKEVGDVVAGEGGGWLKGESIKLPLRQSTLRCLVSIIFWYWFSAVNDSANNSHD